MFWFKMHLETLFFAANFSKDASKICSFIATNKAGKCTDVLSSGFVLMLWKHLVKSL